MTQAELARRARVKAETVNHLVKGRVKKCRKDERTRLAGALGVSVAYLSGNPAAPPPSYEQAMLGPLLDGENVPTLQTRAREWETRAEAEAATLLGDLERVFFPISNDKGDTADPKSPNTGGGERVQPGNNRVNGARMVFRLDRLQSFVSGGEKIATPSPKAADDFTGDVSKVIRALLLPWINGELPPPPNGKRVIAALSGVAVGLINATRNRDAAALENATAQLEAIAADLLRRDIESFFRRRAEHPEKPIRMIREPSNTMGQ